MPVHKRKLKSGATVWMYKFDGPESARQSRKTIRKSGFSSKKEALEAEAERRIEVLRQQELKQEGPQALPKTLAALLEEFFTEHGTKNLAPKTLERYREQVTYLEGALLALPYHEIRPLHLSREWNRLLAGGGHHRKTKAARPLSAKSVRNIASMISSAYERAIEWQIAENNPVRASKPPKVRKKPKPVLMPSQQELLFDAANSTWGLAAFLELDAATGARRGELLALRWSDFNGKTVFIGRSLSQTKTGLFFKECKAGNERTVSLPASAIRALETQRESQTPYRKHFGDAYHGDLIFCNPDGSPLRPDSVSAAVSLLCRRLKLPKGASLHTLRHSHGSHLLAAGVPLPDVSKRLGHTNPQVTATVYAHALPGHDERAAKAWEDFQKRGTEGNEENRLSRRDSKI